MDTMCSVFYPEALLDECRQRLISVSQNRESYLEILTGLITQVCLLLFSVSCCPRYYAVLYILCSTVLFNAHCAVQCSLCSAMLCFTVICYTVLHCAALHVSTLFLHVVLKYTVLCSPVLYYTPLYITNLCCIIHCTMHTLCCATLYLTKLYCTTVCCTLLHCTVLCCIVLCYTLLQYSVFGGGSSSDACGGCGKYTVHWPIFTVVDIL